MSHKSHSTSATISRRTRITLGAVLGMSLLIGAQTYLVGVNASRGASLVLHAMQMQLSLERLVSVLKDAETGQRGYLLTGAKDYLDPYDAATAEIHREIATLGKITRHDAGQQPQVKKLHRLSEAKMAELARTVALAQQSDVPGAIAVVRTHQGKEIMDQIRAVVGNLNRRQEQLLRERRRALDGETRWLSVWFGLGYTLLVLTTLFLYRAVRRYSQSAEAAESELRSLNSRLEQIAEERTASLREKEERLRLAQEAAHVATWEWDMTADRLLGSTEFNQFFGLADGESMAFADWLARVHTDDREDLKRALATLSQTGAGAEAEFRVLHADGRMRWHLAKGASFGNASAERTRALGASIDITDRKVSEANLRASEELLRTFVKYVPAAVSMLDRQLRYLKVSDRWTENYNLQGSPVLGRSIYDVFPGLSKRWRSIYEQCLAGATAKGDEDPIERPDGTLIWLRWEIRPWGNRDGEPEGILIFTENITAYRQMERQLRIRTDALENAMTGFCLLDANGTFTYANRTYLRMWGYDSLDAILGTPAAAHSADGAIAGIISGDCAQTDHCTFEFVAQRRDGATFDALMTMQVSVDIDGHQTYICAALDISERKRAELALQEREATIRTLLETASQAILAVDSGNAVTLANRMAERIFGYKHEEILGRPIESLLSEPFNGQHTRPSSQVASIVWDRQAGTCIQLRGHRRGGSDFPAEVSLSRLETSNGRLAVFFITDITERKQAELALLHSEQELHALAGSLLTAQEDERRRIARDLHDDVTQQMAFLSIETGSVAAALPHEFEDATRRLRSVQARIVRMSDEVRRISHGLHPSILEDLGLSAALEAFCEEFSKREGIPVEFAGDLGDERLSTIATSCLYRVAQEGLRNVSKHAHATRIEVELKSDGDQIELRVRDDGLGMEISKSDRRPRIGLGLASMKERMRLVKGSVVVRSAPGHGTEIVASVPFMENCRETAAHSTG